MFIAQCICSHDSICLTLFYFTQLGDTALHIATKCGNVLGVKMLIDKNAVVFALDEVSL